ncbi:hypothetical protein DV735_g2715, partial [Chaetothyriales sp. CBS 134920]
MPSSRRDTRPQQSLMKPLSPPLPKSQAASQSACFGPSIIPQSSSETRLPWSGHASTRADRQIHVVDALLESRMTEAEIRRLNQESSARKHKRMSSTIAMAATSPASRSTSFSDNVHFAEPGPYWAGRYMSITGRLRQEGMNDNLETPPGSSRSHERASSGSDDQRMKQALSELRSCCRTSLALQSFELFEKSLKKSLAAGPASQNAVKTRAGVDRQPALSSATENGPLNPSSALTTPTKVEHAFPNILSRLTLPKSKTTGNLGAVQSASTLSLAAPMASLTGATEPVSPQHGRRPSGPSVAAENKNALLRDVREFVKTPVKMIHQRFSAVPRTPSYGSEVSTKAEARKLSNSMTMPQIGPSTSANQPANRAQCERVKTPPTVVKLFDEEALIKNRRRSTRKSNSDLVKGVLDASLKQVRLMGKLVGEGVSWMGSQEDLDIKVIATRAK